MRHRFSLTFASFFLTFVAVTCVAYAQSGGGGGGGGGTGGGGGGTGTGGTGGTGGIEVDASGVLRANSKTDATGKVDRELARAAKASLNKDLQQPSQLRMVSLNRLEEAVRKAKAAGNDLPDEIRYLAGLNRITHVFFFPGSKDIVIAGPAEGFFINARNRVVGTETGAATMHLEDLIVALRAYAPNQRPTSVISVSIDPTPQGVVDYNKAFTYWGTAALKGEADAETVRAALVKAMGLQNVTINGVSNKTRFAHVLTEADYRMKLIGLGIETPAVRINNYYDQMPMIAGGNNSSIRWFFQPNYKGISVNSDETAMIIDSANTMELVPAEDRLDGNGQKVSTNKSNKASRNFCASFTKEFDRLAAKDSLYAELRNLVDLSVASAFIQKMDLYGKAGWKMNLFGNEENFPVQRFEAPTHIEPVINFAVRNGAFSAPIAGGVNIQPQVSFRDEAVQKDSGKIDELRGQVKIENLAEGQWWWDQIPVEAAPEKKSRKKTLSCKQLT